MKNWAMAAVLLLAVLATAATGADFDGDGTGDIAIFREASGLWSVRGVTRVYFGTAGDVPVPGDYSGERTDRPAIFRSATGLWSVRGLTRAYFGGSADQPQPGDYNGDGTGDVAIFRPAAGLWSVRGVTRMYFGTSSDIAIDPGPPRYSRSGLLCTGQTTSERSGDDGYYQDGAVFAYQVLDPAGNGEMVTADNITGLMWASDGSAAGCNFGNQTTWNAAIDWAEGLTFAGHSDWKLPNARQLESITHRGRSNPAINTTYFNTEGDWYWSSSNLQGSSTTAWGVDFHYGNVQNFSKTEEKFYVRAVRVNE